MIVIGVAIGALTMWTVVLTFLAWTAIVVSKRNDDAIDAIKRRKGGDTE